MKKSSCMRLFVICLSLMLSISMMPFGVFADAVPLTLFVPQDALADGVAVYQELADLFHYHHLEK